MSGGGGGGGGRDDGYRTPRPSGPGGGSGVDRPAGGDAGGGVGIGRGGGGGGGGSSDPCDIVQTAALNSPKPTVVSTLNVGDVLDVVLGGSSARPILEVHTPAGSVAGSLTHRGHVEIIDCIAAGNTYEAVVVQKSGGIVTVRVQRV